MSSPLEFLRRVAAELPGAGIRFAITSAMACARYHAHFDTPADLAAWPPELDGGRRNGCSSADFTRLQFETSDPRSQSTKPKLQILNPVPL